MFTAPYLLFLAAMVAEAIMGRTHLLAARGRMYDSSGVLSSIIGIAAGLSFFALIVWGFASLRWYVALLTIVLMGTASGIIVGRNSWAFWYQAKAFVDLIAVVLTVFLWWSYWPF